MEGDEFTIDTTKLYVIALGSRANESLMNNGVITVDLSGGIVPTGPNVVMLEGDYKKLDFIRRGNEIEVK